MKNCVYCGVNLDGMQYALDYDENWGELGSAHPTAWHECASCKKTVEDAQKLLKSSSFAYARLVGERQC